MFLYQIAYRNYIRFAYFSASNDKLAIFGWLTHKVLLHSMGRSLTNLLDRRKKKMSL
jgi:hypothetical protein